MSWAHIQKRNKDAVAASWWSDRQHERDREGEVKAAPPEYATIETPPNYNFFLLLPPWLPAFDLQENISQLALPLALRKQHYRFLWRKMQLHRRSSGLRSRWVKTRLLLSRAHGATLVRLIRLETVSLTR
jgi:hypothetical protein